MIRDPASKENKKKGIKERNKKEEALLVSLPVPQNPLTPILCRQPETVLTVEMPVAAVVQAKGKRVAATSCKTMKEANPLASRTSRPWNTQTLSAEEERE